MVRCIVYYTLSHVARQGPQRGGWDHSVGAGTTAWGRAHTVGQNIPRFVLTKTGNIYDLKLNRTVLINIRIVSFTLMFRFLFERAKSLYSRISIFFWKAPR